MWSERDVHGGQSEIRGVISRVEQLGHGLRGIQITASNQLEVDERA